MFRIRIENLCNHALCLKCNITMHSLLEMAQYNSLKSKHLPNIEWIRSKISSWLINDLMRFCKGWKICYVCLPALWYLSSLKGSTRVKISSSWSRFQSIGSSVMTVRQFRHIHIEILASCAASAIVQHFRVAISSLMHYGNNVILVNIILYNCFINALLKRRS